MGLDWKARLRYAALAGLAGWVVGCLVSFPFELSTAWRYVDGHVRLLPAALAEGMVVFAAFSLFMAMAGFFPVILPLMLVVSPGWVVRWRLLLVPLAGLAAAVGMGARMHILSSYYFLLHREVVHAVFFSAPTFFVITFAVVVVWVYSTLVKRRL